VNHAGTNDGQAYISDDRRVALCDRFCLAVDGSRR
jgi:hypothetical protein